MERRLLPGIRRVWRLLESIRVRLPYCHPRRSSQTQSRLLQLPIELLLEISNLLSSASVAALSLTCTSLFDPLFPRTRLQGVQLEDLLQLLEKDLSKQLFFCQPCHTLHPFAPSWGPGLGHQNYFDTRCKPKSQVYDTFILGFHFARLAMNKHFLGGGLSLEQFTCSLPTYTCALDTQGWNMNMTAKVIQDELFLSVSHMLSLTGTGIDNRQVLETLKHGICHHVTTHRPRMRFNVSRNSGGMTSRQWLQQQPFFAKPQKTKIPELGPRDTPRYSPSLTECQDIQGSCNICLTDYTITTLRKCFDNVELWDIIIIVYHQLGPCRSELDWKWLTYATELPDMCEHNMDTSLLGKRCKNGSYAPGSVRARWHTV